jgi:thiamine transport system permease protein
LAGGGDRRAGFSSGGVATAVADGETWKLAGFTVAQAAASPMLAVLAGLPVAFLLARVLLPGIALVRTLVLVPFVLPTVVVGLAFRALSPDGGVASIVLANAFFNVALLARTVLLRRCADPRRRGLPDLGSRGLPPHGAPAQPGRARRLSLVQFAAVVAALAVGTLARKRRETALRLRSGSQTLLLVPIIALVVKSVSTSDG